MRPDAWWNLYTGLPFAPKGRSREGLDCWGLVRLVYAEQFGIALPTLAYEAGDRASEAEASALEREGWELTDLPRSGDVALFRILGEETHVGLITEPGFFLHVRSGQDAVVERLESAKWKHRLVGIYRYRAAGSAVTLAACPHPLKARRLDFDLPAGLTLAQMIEIAARAVPAELQRDAVVSVDGEYIPREAWETCLPRPGARVEYRAVPGDDDFGKLFAMVAIAAFAWYVAPAIAGVGAMGSGVSTLATSLISFGINQVGSLLVNSIFPSRQDDARNNPAPYQPKPVYMLQGGQNQATPYAAIPIVLGRYRYTPPVGAQTYSEATATEGYLRMLLLWGYGPLQVSDLKIGATPIEQYLEVTQETITGWQDSAEDHGRFNEVYGEDVAQEQVNVKLECKKAAVTSATRTSNVVTVATTAAHGYSIGWYGWLDTTPTGTEGEILTVPDSTHFTFASTGADGALTCSNGYFGNRTTRVLNGTVRSLSVTLAFPQGLWKMLTSGEDAGAALEAGITGSVQFRKVDAYDAPLTAWAEVNSVFRLTGEESIINLRPAWWFNADTGENARIYQWTRASLDRYGKLVVRTGGLTDVYNQEASATLLAYQEEASYGVEGTYARLPALGTGEEHLWDICVYGAAVDMVKTVDQRGVNVTGCGITVAGLAVTLAAGTVSRATSTIKYGGTGEDWHIQKDAFNATIKWDVDEGRYEVRAVRLSDDTVDFAAYHYYHDMYFGLLTGFNGGVRPIAPPTGITFAKTAISIQATNQLNGNADGITGTVTSICMDWIGGPVTSISRTANVITVGTTRAHELATGEYVQVHGVADSSYDTTWVAVASTPTTTSFTYADTGANGSSSGGYVCRKQPTRNPASLFRWVLQHPANARKLVDSKIDLSDLAVWHEFCRLRNYSFDTVITGQRSLFDVLADVAAAGRASPTMVDGKWTVVIDKAVSTYAQHFTPHNSWGFSAVRAYPRMPHAFRIQFANAQRGYQPDEMFVYDDDHNADGSGGKTIATEFEGLSLPGVTNPDLIHHFGRFHLRQIQLRPETYSINCDIEHLVCQRGDLVKITHDVPMWGLGTGRIKTYTDGTHLVLDEAVPMVAATTYTIRIRLADGSSITRTVASVGSDGYYTAIVLTASVTSTEGAPGNLFMFGALNAESIDCIVLAIEPTDNLCARITLADYSPAIFDVEGETIPTFNSRITLPPVLMQYCVQAAPSISDIVSDERAMERLSPRVYRYFIRGKISTSLDTARHVTHVQVQYKRNYARAPWKDIALIPVAEMAFAIPDVREAVTYAIRARYRDENTGRFGPWCAEVTETVDGRLNPPAAVTGLGATVSDHRLLLDWLDNSEPDVEMYEVRKADSNWGVKNSDRIFFGAASSCFYKPPASAGVMPFYVKARDSAGHWSTTAAYLSIEGTVPGKPQNVTATFSDTSRTTARVRINWDDATSQFPIDYYQTNITKPGGRPTRTAKLRASEWTIDADWVGEATLTVKAVNVFGWQSDVETLLITKSLPNLPGAPTKTVWTNQNGCAAKWDWSDAGVKTTLPVAGYEIRSADSGFGTAGYVWRGTATEWTKWGMSTPATYTYYLRPFDTDGNYAATSLTISHDYSPPPTIAYALMWRNKAVLTIAASDTTPSFTKPTVPSDFDAYVFRIGKVRTGATGGDDTPDGIVASGDFWTDPDAVEVRTKWPWATLNIHDWPHAGESKFATYRAAIRMVDKASNYSSASALGSIAVSKIT